MYILIIAMIIVLTSIAIFFLQSKKEKVSIKAKLLTSTQLNIDYHILKDKGQLQIIKSSDCLETRIDPTLQGWKITTPIDATTATILNYLRDHNQNFRSLNSRHEVGADLLSYFLTDNRPKRFNDLTLDERNGLYDFNHGLIKQINNLTRFLPDITFPELSYVLHSEKLKRKIKNEQPQSA